MPSMSETRAYWRLCTSCGKELPFGEIYWVCSVSTCNRKKMPLTFCSVPCWDAHLPTMRHREAWAEERRAPTRAQWDREQADGAAAERRRKIVKQAASAPPAPVRTPSVTPGGPPPEISLNDDDLPRDILIVASKLKMYIKARSGMKTSDGVMRALSDIVRKECDEAIRRAARAERKTVMDRDF